LISLDEAAVAARLPGASGAVSEVVAFAVFEYAEFPAELYARTRYEYAVEVVSSVFAYVSTFDPTVAIWLKEPPETLRSTLKPVSLFALSDQVRLI